MRVLPMSTSSVVMAAAPRAPTPRRRPPAGGDRRRVRAAARRTHRCRARRRSGPAWPGPATTRTSRSRSASASRHSAMNGARPCCVNCARPRRYSPTSAVAMPLRSAGATPTERRSTAAVPVAATAARSASSRCRFRPMPMTTKAGPPDSARRSIRMPPAFPAGVTRSFGHLSCRPRAPQAASARNVQTPIASDSDDSSRGNGSKLAPTDRQRLPPSDASQLRPRRPRPALWCSASSTSQWPGGGAPRSEQRGVGRGHRPLDVEAVQRRAQRRLEGRRDPRRVERVGRVAATIAAMRHRLDRHAEFAQRLDRLPDGAARDARGLGQRLAGMERAVGERRERALRGGRGGRAGSCARPAPQPAEQPQAARTRLGAGAHPAQVAAMGPQHQQRAGDAEGDQRRRRRRPATRAAPAPAAAMRWRRSRRSRRSRTAAS